MRLIDADELIKAIVNTPTKYDDRDMPLTDAYTALAFRQIEILGLIEKQPTVSGWISCKEKLPENLDPVNVTWVNHKPVSYYDHIKDVPFTATAYYYNGQWFWYSCRCADLLREYGYSEWDSVDENVEIIAWMPPPKPYKGE